MACTHFMFRIFATPCALCGAAGFTVVAVLALALGWGEPAVFAVSTGCCCVLCRFLGRAADADLLNLRRRPFGAGTGISDALSEYRRRQSLKAWRHSATKAAARR